MNRARPKGCIAECYQAVECLMFCGGYVKQAGEVGVWHARNEDFENQMILEGRSISGGKDIRVPNDMLRLLIDTCFSIVQKSNHI